MSHFPIQLITSLSGVAAHTLIIEIRSISRVQTLIQYGFSDLQIKKIWENFDLSKEKKEKTLIFSHISTTFNQIICFFPSEELMDDRSEYFQTINKEVIFFPEDEELDAFETITLSTYSFEKYLTKTKEYQVTLLISQKNLANIEAKKPLLETIIWARNLINTPAKDTTPEKIVDEIQKYPWKHFTIDIFNKADLEKLWCNLLLAVGAGSDNPPYMVIIKPKNPPKWEKYGFIGKGVTFDAGGIQIKPDTAMLDMKCDMSGAAGMIALAMYLDTLSTLPVNITVGVWLTENMTGWSAFKPLDIYRAYNNTTVEIHHTDAEWRLVLADVMSYIERQYHVEHLVTMATLTGACVYALWNDISGIMGDDEDVISTLIDNRSPYEKVWRLPMNEKFKKSLKADIADIKNIAKSEKAGSSIGGAFLSYFQWNAKLTHLDIAGPAYRETTYGYMTKWGTGWGVKLLSEFLIGKWKSK